MKRVEMAMLVGLMVSIVLGSTAAFAKECAQIEQNVVRLHILANSDSEEDQALKLKVRDAVLEATDQIFGTPQDKAAAKAEAERKLPLIEQTAAQVIAQEGYDYPVKAQVVQMYFDTRHYDGFDLPAGQYDAVRVTIGTGQGHNWWCVVFPPMCITAAQPAGTQPIQEQILSLGETPVYQPKLAVVEWYEGLKEWGREHLQSPAT